MRKIVAAAGLGVLVALCAAPAASADPVSPAPGHVERTWHGTPRVVRSWSPPAPVVVQPVAVRTWVPAQVRVQPGDTLWGLAQTWLGSGYRWTVLAELNGVNGTTIYAGQLLRLR